MMAFSRMINYKADNGDEDTYDSMFYNFDNVQQFRKTHTNIACDTDMRLVETFIHIESNCSGKDAEDIAMMKSHLTHIAIAYDGASALKKKPIQAQVHSIDTDVLSSTYRDVS